MIIRGFQKLTLLDYPGHTACTVFIGGCNYRCPFCHNASLVLHPEQIDPIPRETVMAFLKKRRGILDGVCITGGEPLLYADIVDFMKEIHNIGFSVKLDTNGSFPDRLGDVIQGNLVDYVAMDIKAPPEKYGAATGVPEISVESVEKSVELLRGGTVPYEFRTTVVKGLHTPEDVGRMAAWLAGASRYFIQCFRDSGEILSDGLAAPSVEELKAMLAAARRYIPAAELRGVDL